LSLAGQLLLAILALFLDHYGQEEHKEDQADTDCESVPEIVAHQY